MFMNSYMAYGLCGQSLQPFTIELRKTTAVQSSAGFVQWPRWSAAGRVDSAVAQPVAQTSELCRLLTQS